MLPFYVGIISIASFYLEIDKQKSRIASRNLILLYTECYLRCGTVKLLFSIATIVALP